MFNVLSYEVYPTYNHNTATNDFDDDADDAFVDVMNNRKILSDPFRATIRKNNSPTFEITYEKVKERVKIMTKQQS